MIEYPTSEPEFESTFKDEASAMEYIISVRWPNGLYCPKCQNDKLWRNDSGRVLECSACGHRLRPLVGTIFQDTRIPVLVWLRTIWHIMSQKYGANATGLSRSLNLAFTTTWNILHKLRRTMVRAGREFLGPVVEVDEFYIGGVEKGIPGHGAEKKSLIALAIDLSTNRKTVGRSRMERIEDASAASLIPFVARNVEPGATVMTDGWSGYNSLNKEGFKHVVWTPKRGEEAMPHVHTVISLVKRWILGTFQGSVSHRHLEYYLSEYVFRFNRRKSKSRGKLFRRLVEQAVVTPPITRAEMRRPVQERDKEQATIAEEKTCET